MKRIKGTYRLNGDEDTKRWECWVIIPDIIETGIDRTWATKAAGRRFMQNLAKKWNLNLTECND